MKIQRTKRTIRKVLPKPLWISLAHIKDASGLIPFLFKGNPNVSLSQRLSIIKQLHVISKHIDCQHNQHEIISFIEAIFSIPQKIEGCIVEAGSYKGGSTAKFSIAAKIAKRKLVVFDSFEGIPPHNELHDKDIFGNKLASFPKGIYYGTLDEVKRNIIRFGSPEVCELIKGLFEDTMPGFSKRIVAIYLDVDLASSTRTCLNYLYPLLIPGGILYSQDGHLQLVIDVLSDDEFWKKEVGYRKPNIAGLGKQRLIKIVKPGDQ